MKPQERQLGRPDQSGTDDELPFAEPDRLAALATQVLERCDVIAGFTEEPGKITRTFLSEPMHGLRDRLGNWMRAAGMQVHCDAIGNLIGHYPGATPEAPLLLVGSHLDSVPDAGKYDGVLGVLLALAAVQASVGRAFPFAIDVIAFCEEEGVRYRTPYLGSLAVCGRFESSLLDRIDANGVTMAEAMRKFGLDPAQIPSAAYPAGRVFAYLEAHIEQGPVLEAQGVALGVVEAIVGQTRIWARFDGHAGHAGTLPMELRRDALAAASLFVLEVERLGRSVAGLRATVGTLHVSPGAVNVVPGSAALSVDLRHADDQIRQRSFQSLLERADAIAQSRGVCFRVVQEEHHHAVPCDPALTELLACIIQEQGLPVHRMASGAGHDAAIMANLAPMTMLFLRSPGGVSHHPNECVWPHDVQAALGVLIRFLDRLAQANR